MRRKSVKGRITKATNYVRKEVTKTVEKTVALIQKTPSKDTKDYLCDERWDMLPKTDYTYAKSGSYSPRFCGRKYLNPNMSRYRIHHGQDSTMANRAVLDDIDYDLMHSEYNAEEINLDHEKELNITDSDIYCERTDDRMQLRSLKRMKAMKRIFHERDAELQQTEGKSTSNKTAYTTSKVGSYSRSQKELLETNLSSQPKSTNGNIQKSNNKETVGKHINHSTSDVAFSKSSSYVDKNDAHTWHSFNGDFNLNSYSHNIFSSTSVHSGSFFNRILSRPSLAMNTSGQTFTQHVNNGCEEKGATERSEKVSYSQQGQRTENSIRLYGQGYDGEFSDTDSTYLKSSSSYGSGFISNTYHIKRRSVITSTFTTTMYTAWNYVGQPIVSTVSTVLTLVGYLLWLLLSHPILLLARVITDLFSLMSAHGTEGLVKGVVSSVIEWLWRKAENVSLQFVLLDVWIFKRRKRGCCLCLPLLLLLPLLLILLSGVNSVHYAAILDTFTYDKVYQQTKIDEGTQPISSSLSNEIGAMILQLKSSHTDQLNAADVEAIVYKVLAKEITILKPELERTRNEEHVQWKKEREREIQDVWKKHKDILNNIQDLKTIISEHKRVIVEQRAEMKAESAQHDVSIEQKLAALEAELHSLEEEHAALLAQVSICCHNETYHVVALKDNVNSILSEIMTECMSGNPTQDAFIQWLRSNYVDRKVFDKSLQDLSTELIDTVVGMMRDLQKQQHEHSQTNQSDAFAAANGSIVTEQQVQLMIEEALFQYNADKTGLADYALESAGGSIVSTRCSETYYKKTALISIFGIPLWYTTNSPRTVIQPDVYPGQCWAFKGAVGYIVIRTSITIIPTGFTLEHIPKSLAFNGSITSAPKDFTVLGLDSEFENNAVSLGNYTYRDDGKPVQSFLVQNHESVKPYSLYELRILSNYGNLDHTCIYRFRIHGKPMKREA